MSSRYRLEYNIFYTGIGGFRADGLYEPEEFITLMNENKASFRRRYFEPEMPDLDPSEFSFTDLQELVNWAGAEFRWTDWTE